MTPSTDWPQSVRVAPARAIEPVPFESRQPSSLLSEEHAKLLLEVAHHVFRFGIVVAVLFVIRVITSGFFSIFNSFESTALHGALAIAALIDILIIVFCVRGTLAIEHLLLLNNSGIPCQLAALAKPPVFGALTIYAYIRFSPIFTDILDYGIGAYTYVMGLLLAGFLLWWAWLIHLASDTLFTMVTKVASALRTQMTAQPIASVPATTETAFTPENTHPDPTGEK